jgi:hypothetical protein
MADELQNEGNSCSDYSDNDSSFDSEVSSDDSFSEHAGQGTAGSDLFRAFLSQIPPDHAEPVPVETRTPQELWNNFIGEVSNSQTKVLKITDSCAEKYALETQSETMTSQLSVAVASARGITHVILGNSVLKLLKKTGQQKILLSSIVRHHQESLTYVKLGSDNITDSSLFGLVASAILNPLNEYRDKLKLNEFEIRGLEIVSREDITSISEILLGGKASIRQLNLLGVDTGKAGQVSFDPLIDAARQSTCLDELRIERIGCFTRDNLVSAESLNNLLLEKKKWWRLALCGLGLTDSHCHIMANLFSRDSTCKVGDLLSLKNNPSMSQAGYADIFKVFFNKQRMGLIKVDDLEWERKFDLVRSMNNLHGRLQFVEEGALEDRGKWLEWLTKLGNLGWEDDKHKINYLWFTILEKPEFVRGA